MAYSPWGRKESDMIERLHFSQHQGLLPWRREWQTTPVFLLQELLILEYLAFKNTLCSAAVLWLCESLVLCNCIRADHDITWETLLSANVLPAPTLHSLSGLCLEGYLSIVPKKIYT